MPTGRTGRVEERLCTRCGSLVDHAERAGIGAFPERLWWRPEPHEAACGRPCVAGAEAPLPELASGGFHGFRDRCPRCGAAPRAL